MDFIIKEAFLSVVRTGIGHRADALPSEVDWNELKDLAKKQGLSAVVLDGIERLPEQKRPPKLFLLEWIGETLQGYKYRYELYQRAIAELAEYYNSHGYKMMVLKGYACSLDWPKPEHRPCGDIDIWLYGKQREADVVLAKEKGIDINKKHEHHTVFYWNDFMVENHYDFINIHRHYSHRGLEQIYKELGQDDSNYVDLRGEKVYLPSTNLHALFLIRHALNHFTSIGINLRQVMDWAFFAEKHTSKIDWQWLIGILEKYHMMNFYNCLNAICVEDLGFDASIFHQIQFSPILKDRVLNDILFPEFTGDTPKALLPRVLFKYRRWKANGWKNELCFKESMWSAFWSGVWGHILKPNQI